MHYYVALLRGAVLWNAAVCLSVRTMIQVRMSHVCINFKFGIKKSLLVC